MKQAIVFEDAVQAAAERLTSTVRRYGIVPKKTNRERRKRSKSERTALGMAVVRAVRDAAESGLLRKTENGYSMIWND